MSKLDEIHRLFKLASVPLKDSDSLTIEKLADLLDEQEVISHAALGSHNGDSGVLITSPSRLLFAGIPKGKKSKSDLKVVGIPYERVEAVEYGDSRGTGVLFIVSSGIKSEFSCDAKQVKVIAEHIHAGAPSPAPLVAGKRPSTSTAVKAIAFVLIALAGINLLSAIFGGGDKPEPPKVQQEAPKRASALEAKMMCRQFVERSLKAPSTADFPFSDEFSAVGKDNGPYIVIGYVDAQNSFGAMLRTHFTCELHTDGKEWFLDNLTMN
jgi:hypothetical protein